MSLSCYTGIPVTNKVLDSNGVLKPIYWNVRYVRNGEVSGEFQMSLPDAVDDAVRSNMGVAGLSKVEWCGEHIGAHWIDVTDRFRYLYHGMTNLAK